MIIVTFSIIITIGTILRSGKNETYFDEINFTYSSAGYNIYQLNVRYDIIFYYYHTIVALANTPHLHLIASIVVSTVRRHEILPASFPPGSCL